mmetsp:Transcript_56109/g.142859  ORF Transcript_56109/g.142859 Transcript_56109/m.142859 type:complete len:229 (+) Transcript_56109:362-1048(+)
MLGTDGWTMTATSLCRVEVCKSPTTLNQATPLAAFNKGGALARAVKRFDRGWSSPSSNSTLISCTKRNKSARWTCGMHKTCPSPPTHMSCHLFASRSDGRCTSTLMCCIAQAMPADSSSETRKAAFSRHLSSSARQSNCTNRTNHAATQEPSRLPVMNLSTMPTYSTLSWSSCATSPIFVINTAPAMNPPNHLWPEIEIESKSMPISYLGVHVLSFQKPPCNAASTWR